MQQSALEPALRRAGDFCSRDDDVVLHRSGEADVAVVRSATRGELGGDPGELQRRRHRAVEEPIAFRCRQAVERVCRRRNNRVGGVPRMVHQPAAGWPSHHGSSRREVRRILLKQPDAHRRRVPAIDAEQRPPALGRSAQQCLVQSHVHGRITRAVEPKVPRFTHVEAGASNTAQRGVKSATGV